MRQDHGLRGQWTRRGPARACDRLTGVRTESPQDGAALPGALGASAGKGAMRGPVGRPAPGEGGGDRSGWQGDREGREADRMLGAPGRTEKAPWGVPPARREAGAAQRGQHRRRRIRAGGRVSGGCDAHAQGGRELRSVWLGPDGKPAPEGRRV